MLSRDLSAGTVAGTPIHLLGPDPVCPRYGAHAGAVGVRDRYLSGTAPSRR